MKINWIIKTIVLILITKTHWLLNKFESQNKKSTILYSEYDHLKHVLKPIKKELKGQTINNLTKFDIKSFFKRKNNKTIEFNNIIKKPFRKICFNEEEFEKYFNLFLEENYQIFLKENKFNKIIMIDEFSLPNLNLTRCTKNKNIRTISIQHGIIQKDHKNYLKYIKRNKKEIVDYIIVYSKEEQKILTKKSVFTTKNVIALGCPRYDKLVNKKYHESKILKKYKLNENKINILWATQSHDKVMREVNESKINCDIIFEFFKKHREYQLIIKLHPNEKQTKTIYHKYNNKFGQIAKIMNREKNTNELLSICNILMTKSSTVGMEAIIMNKPLLILDFVKSIPYKMFVYEGFNQIAKNKKQLKEKIEFIQSKEYQKIFLKKREVFLNKRFFNIGKATGEVVRFIKNV